jgi:hypothetical protein
MLIFSPWAACYFPRIVTHGQRAPEELVHPELLGCGDLDFPFSGEPAAILPTVRTRRTASHHVEYTSAKSVGHAMEYSRSAV